MKAWFAMSQREITAGGKVGGGKGKLARVEAASWASLLESIGRIQRNGKGMG